MKRIDKINRIVAVLLIAMACVSALVACAKKSEAPEGMYSVTLDRDPFVLYVPEGWTDNKDSGISSAYYSLIDAVMVSAKCYPIDSEVTDIKGYLEGNEESLRKAYPAFSRIDQKASMLGGQNAVRYEYSFEKSVKNNEGSENVTMRAIGYYTIYNGEMVVLSQYCINDKYEEYKDDFERIRNEFVLRARSATPEATTDKNTPAGMKIASHKTCQYVFYVPSNWDCDPSNKMTEAYIGSGRSRCGITVTVYAPGAEITPKEYFEECEKLYTDELVGYNRSEEPKEIKVGGVKGLSYTYGARYGEEDYKIMQTVFVYNDLAYSITYTARQEYFDANKDDVNDMINAFRFR